MAHRPSQNSSKPWRKDVLAHALDHQPLGLRGARQVGGVRGEQVKQFVRQALPQLEGASKQAMQDGDIGDDSGA